MPRLIDADALIPSEVHTVVMRKADGKEVWGSVLYAEQIYRYLCDSIEDCETVEAEPIKHGRWIVKIYEHKYKNGYWTERRTECSVCGSKPLYDEFQQKAESDYCPQCGAKMDLTE